MKGLIVSSGEIKDYELLKQVVEENDYIVCADGGINHILKINKKPDIVLGDLDSIGKEGLKILNEENIEIQRFPVMKDETDTEICVNHLLKKGFKDITLMGVTGTRFDHMLANMYLLRKIYHLGSEVCIIDKNNRIYYCDDSISLKKREGFFISIIPISEEGIIVSLNGFLYPLKKDYIECSSTRGISNKIVEEYGDIKIHRGEAFVIESKD